MSLWSNTKQPNTDLQHKLDSAKTADDTKKVTIDNKSKNGQDSEQKKNRPPNTAPTTRSSLQAALICLFSKECAHLHNRDTYGHLIGSNGKLSIVFFFPKRPMQFSFGGAVSRYGGSMSSCVFIGALYFKCNKRCKMS